MCVYYVCEYVCLCNFNVSRRSVQQKKRLSIWLLFSQLFEKYVRKIFLFGQDREYFKWINVRLPTVCFMNCDDQKYADNCLAKMWKTCLLRLLLTSLMLLRSVSPTLKALICQTKSAAEMDLIQFEKIHEENKRHLGEMKSGMCVNSASARRGKKDDSYKQKPCQVYDTYALSTCPISYLSVTSDMLS